MSETPTKIRVTNITKNPGRRFLDPGDKYGNRIIAPGHSMFFDTPDGTYPECIQPWIEQNWVKIEDAKSGSLLSAPVSGELTPGLVSPIREMRSSDEHDDFGEDIDLEDAREAILPGHLAGKSPIESTSPMVPDTRQQRAKVTTALRDEQVPASQGFSPIPGDTPRSVDESDKFTIKAPRSHAVGSVIGKR